jgi:biotin synthase
VVQAPLLTACNPPNADFLGEPEIPMREWLNQLANRIIAGDRIKREEAIALTQIEGKKIFSYWAKPLIGCAKLAAVIR